VDGGNGRHVTLIGSRPVSRPTAALTAAHNAVVSSNWSPFLCAGGDTAHTLLGSHDGHESWTILIGLARDDNERLLVSLHEKKHQELQDESPWGLLMMLVQAGASDHTTFPALARRCKRVHEVFATYFSVGTDRDFLELLDGNELYERHYSAGRRLADPSRGGSPRLADAILRLTMAPRELTRLTLAEIIGGPANSYSDRLSPDVRLRRIETLLRNPAVGVAERLAGLASLPVDMDGLTAFRDHIAAWMTEAGLDTMTVAEHAAWAGRLVAEIDERGRQSTFRLAIEDRTVRDVLASDVDDMGRERLQLHPQRLPLEIVPPDDLQTRARDFARGHAEFGVHSLIVWLRTDLLARQFELPTAELTSQGGSVLGLLACDRVHGSPIARLCPFVVPPAVLFAAIAKSNPIIFLTSLASIIDTNATADLRGVAPVFALVDQPVLAFCAHTIEVGAVLRWRTLAIDGDRPLSLFLFENDEIEDVFYLHFATAVGRHHLVRWLRREEPGAEFVASLADGIEARLSALIEHIVGTFWRLDQFGGRAS